MRSDHAQGYIRVDWYTPDGLPNWGDGRLTILGTDGYIELRKYVDIVGRPGTDHPVGARAPAHCTSVGKVLLAHQPQEIVRQVIDNGLTRFTQNTIITGEALPSSPPIAVHTPAPGTSGGVDFRAGSLPVVVQATDAHWHDSVTIAPEEVEIGKLTTAFNTASVPCDCSSLLL